MTSSIAYTMSTMMTLYSSASTATNAEKVNTEPAIELFDWFANKKHIRGSREGDNGIWINNSAKPISFCPKSRVVVLEDGTRYLLNRKTASKALGLDKMSEQVLLALPLTI